MDMTQVQFSSNTEVERLVASGSTAVGSGTTLLYTFTNSLEPPTFEVQFSPDGNMFYQPGYSELGSTGVLFHAYAEATGIYITAFNVGTARFYIWADKVNY